MIPETAIQAAAKATYEAGPGYELTGHKPWEELSNTSRANATRNATAALTAALPLVRAQISSELRQLSHEADTPAEQLGYLLAAIHVNEGTLQ